jgi:hypothetical protein
MTHTRYGAKYALVANEDDERPRRRDSDENYGCNCKEQVRSRKILIVCLHLVASNVTLAMFTNCGRGMNPHEDQKTCTLHRVVTA